MLPCVCSLIDHRWRQNVVITSVTHSVTASCATFLLLPHFTAKWNLFVLYNKETTTAFLFQNLNYSKAGLCPLWQARKKKAFWHNLLSIQNEAIWTENILKKQLFENYDLTKITWSPCLSTFKQIQNDQLLMRFQDDFQLVLRSLGTLMFLKIINSHLMECRSMFVTNHIPNIWGLSTFHFFHFPTALLVFTDAKLFHHKWY